MTDSPLKMQSVAQRKSAEQKRSAGLTILRFRRYKCLERRRRAALMKSTQAKLWFATLASTKIQTKKTDFQRNHVNKNTGDRTNQ